MAKPGPKKGSKKGKARRAGGLLIGGESLKGLIKGAAVLSAVKFGLRFTGISQRAGRFQQPLEEFASGGLLQVTKIGGGADLMSAGTKGLISEGLEFGAEMVTGQSQGFGGVPGSNGGIGAPGVDLI